MQSGPQAHPTLTNDHRPPTASFDSGRYLAYSYLDCALDSFS